MNVGDTAVLTAGMTVIRDDYDNGPRYTDARALVAPLLMEDTRQELLAFTHDRKAWAYEWIPGVADTTVTAVRLGTILSHRFALSPPRALLAHRDTALPYHRDTRQPYPCMNMTLLYAHGCSGGELILGDLAFACQDAWVVVFDGQALHGVAPLRLAKGGWRVAVTFYCPSGGSE